MTPTSVLGVIVFLAVLLPGFTWLWTSERRGPMVTRSPSVAIAELAVVGTLAAAAAFTLVVLLGTRLSWLVDVPAWLRAGDLAVFLADHIWQAVASFFLQILGGTALAAGAAAILRRPGRTTFHPGSTVLHQVLEEDRVSAQREREAGDGQTVQAMVALTTREGTVIEGYLRCFPADRDEPFLAVESPVFMTREDGVGERVKQPADAVIINLDQVVHAAVQYQTASTYESDTAS